MDPLVAGAVRAVALGGTLLSLLGLVVRTRHLRAPAAAGFVVRDLALADFLAGELRLRLLLFAAYCAVRRRLH